MRLVRLVYFSRNTIDATNRSMVSQVADLLGVARRNNEKMDITGALLFDRAWFAQTLEGDLTSVWATYTRLLPDPRHRNIVFLEMKAVERRVFGNWWMGCGEVRPMEPGDRSPHLHEGKFLPEHMGADRILSLSMELATMGHDRRLAG